MAWGGIRVTTTHGINNPICRDAAKMVREIPGDFDKGSWRSRFGEIAWRKDSFPAITAEGTHLEHEFEYLPIDIDNDGINEVAVKITGFVRSVDWDHLYIFQTEQFRSAQQEKSVGKLLTSVPSLNPQNYVRFKSGISAVPVELHIWKRDGANLLVLKEHFFTKDKKGVPSALFIARLDKKSMEFDAATNMQRLAPKIVCRMVMK